MIDGYAGNNRMTNNVGTGDASSKPTTTRSHTLPNYERRAYFRLPAVASRIVFAPSSDIPAMAMAQRFLCSRLESLE